MNYLQNNKQPLLNILFSVIHFTGFSVGPCIIFFYYLEDCNEIKINKRKNDREHQVHFLIISVD